MNAMSRWSKLACGISGIIAISFVSGCAAPTVTRPMDQHSLAMFQIDCSKKQEQITFLRSQITNRDDRFWSWLENYVKGWEQYTNPAEYNRRHAIVSNRTNWLINQTILRLSRDCP